jgi:hypothetical protein
LCRRQGFHPSLSPLVNTLEAAESSAKARGGASQSSRSRLLKNGEGTLLAISHRRESLERQAEQTHLTIGSRWGHHRPCKGFERFAREEALVGSKACEAVTAPARDLDRCQLQLPIE